MSQKCRHCQASVMALTGGSRTVALMRFVQLQQAGFLPAMCESADGGYSVCYDAMQRRPGDDGRAPGVRHPAEPAFRNCSARG